jgi:hypothetical protein
MDMIEKDKTGHLENMFHIRKLVRNYIYENGQQNTTNIALKYKSKHRNSAFIDVLQFCGGIHKNDL